MPRTRTNTSATVNVPTTTETVLATIVIPSAPAGAPIDLEAVVTVTSGANTGSCTVQIERGSVAGSPSLALVSSTFAASVSIVIPIMAVDTQNFDITNQSYVVTALQGSGATFTCSRQALQAIW